MKSTLLWISTLLCMAAVSCAARAAPSREVLVIGSVGAGSAAYGINSAGQVAGQLTPGGQQHAFYFDGATLCDLGALPTELYDARSVNNAGMTALPEPGPSIMLGRGLLALCMPALWRALRRVERAVTLRDALAGTLARVTERTCAPAWPSLINMPSTGALPR